MNIVATPKDGMLIVTLDGRLDTFGAPPVQRALDAHFHEKPRAVIMDFTGVDFISSAGIRVLLIAAKEAEARKGILALAGLKPYCRELLQTIRIADSMPQFNTVDQAEAFCRGQQGQ